MKKTSKYLSPKDIFQSYHRLLTGASAGAIALSILPHQVAIAQDNETYLDQVVVLAQKREQNLRDVPTTVSSFSDSFLAERGIVDTVSLSKITPSFNLNSSISPQFQGITIRGLGTFTTSQGLEPSVTTMVDGVVLSRNAQAFFDFTDVEQIEVLRGPQGTLFGKGSSAGLISIRTKGRGEGFEATLGTQYEPGDTMYQVNGDIGVPLGDRAYLRVAAFTKQADGFINNVFDGRDYNSIDRYGAKVKLFLEPSDAFRLKLTADYIEDDNDCCAVTARQVSNPAVVANLAPVVAGPENDQANFDGNAIFKSESKGIALEAEWDLNDFSLTSITAYREYELLSNSDSDFLPCGTGMDGFAAPCAGVFNTGDRIDQFDTKNFSQELVLKSPTDGPFSYIVGAYFADMELNNVLLQESFIPPLLPRVDVFNTVGVLESRHYSVFTHLAYQVSDRLTAEGGMRVSHEKIEGTFTNRGLNAEPFIFGGTGAFTSTASDTDVGLSGKFSLLYQLTDDTNVFASYARGYKGPGLDMAEGQNRQAVWDATAIVAAEKVDSFELGVKSYLLDGNMNVNATLFWTTAKDFQTAGLNAVGASTTGNAGEARSYGLEMEVDYAPSEDWRFYFSGLFMEPEYTDYTNAPCFSGQTAAQGCTPTGQDVTGNQLTRAPKIKVHGSARYTTELGSSSTRGYAHVSAQWQDDMQVNQASGSGTIIPSYGTVDFRLGVTGEYGDGMDYDIALYLDNALDQSYPTSIFSFLNSGGAEGNGQQVLSRGYERRFGINARFNF